jgi:uncharacterized protein DUF87
MTLEQIVEAQRSQQDKVAGLIMKFAGNRRVSILTNSIYKTNAGELGLPKGMFLVMIPTGQYAKTCYPHFILLRRTKITDTPTTDDEVKMTVMAAKRNMDINNAVITGDMNWDAFEASIVGSYRVDEEDGQTIKFLRSTPSLGTGRDYAVYTPSAEMLDIIANSTVTEQNGDYETFNIGKLRISEFGALIKGPKWPETAVLISKGDFINTRTAIFGKTRMGKSNIAKTIALNMNGLVSQLIFDQSGEYCNPNPQDNNTCLGSLIPDCKVFGLSESPDNPDRENICPDFYLHPKSAMLRLISLLRADGKGTANYQQNMLSVDIPTIEETKDADFGEATRMIRKIKIFWAILAKAGFEVNEDALPYLHVGSGNTSSAKRGRFCLGLRADIFQRIYLDDTEDPPISIPIERWPRIDSLAQLSDEIEEVYALYKSLKGREHRQVFSRDDNETFDDDDIRLIEFLCAGGGRSGARLLSRYHKYHSMGGEDGSKRVLETIDQNKTVIIDVGREDSELVQLTSHEITTAVFNHQVSVFNSKQPEIRSIILYYEEAHNLFPLQSPYNKEPQTIYTKVAKEGAKFGIGMVYITQSPTTMDNDLLGQTDNFFAVGMSSIKEVDRLADLNNNFEEHKNDILESVDKGFTMMLTLSNKFVIPVQANRLFGSKPKVQGGR